MLVIFVNTKGGGKQSDSTSLGAQVINGIALEMEPKPEAQVADACYKQSRFSP